jgi:hypothetical protein
VDINVYAIELKLNSVLLSATKNWYSSSKQISLVNTLIQSTDKEVNKENDLPKITIKLKFLRDLSTNQVIQGFKDAFIGQNIDDTNNFIKILSEILINRSGIKTGEEILFEWKDGCGLNIKSGNIYRTLDNPQVETYFLGVYLDSKRTVSPDLLKSLELNVLKET